MRNQESDGKCCDKVRYCTLTSVVVFHVSVRECIIERCHTNVAEWHIVFIRLFNDIVVIIISSKVESTRIVIIIIKIIMICCRLCLR